MNYAEHYVNFYHKARFGRGDLFGVEEQEMVCHVRLGEDSIATVYAYVFPKSIDKADFESWATKMYQATGVEFCWIEDSPVC